MRLMFVNQLPLDYFINSKKGQMYIPSSSTVHALPIHVLCVRMGRKVAGDGSGWLMRKVDNWWLLVDAKCWQLWFMANW